LGKCFATTSLLTQIIVAKYADSLPLYRQETILQRYGANVNRANMANWIIRLLDPMTPLLNRLSKHQKQHDYLQADETRIQVLKEDGKPTTSNKWMWVIRCGPPDKQAVRFHYDPSRAGAVARRLLEGFTGTLKADGYSGYGVLCKDNPDITRIGCFDHARRKFVDATRAAGTKKKTGKATKANVALSHIRKLYAIEKTIADKTPEQKYQARQEMALPILETFKTWLENNITKVLKGGLTYKAMQYALNQWEYLIGYCHDGKLNISNALAENAILPFAVGRRNWLFSDTSKGAHASAAFYSLIETAKTNNLEPYGYIKYILDNIAEANTADKLDKLLPWNVPVEHYTIKCSPEWQEVDLRSLTLHLLTWLT
jgi:transposase